MYNLIRTEFYKLKRDKAYKNILMITGILILLCITLVVLKSGTISFIQIDIKGYTYGFIINKFANKNNPTLMEILNSAKGFSVVLQILIMFFATSFVLNEYKYGTFRNLIAGGNTRMNIYISKLLAVSFGIFIMNLFMIFGSVLGGVVFCKSAGFLNYNTILEMFKFILLSLLVFTAMASLYMCISIIVKNKSIVVAAGIILLFSEPMILSMTNHTKWGDYLPTFLLMKICSINLDTRMIFNIILVCTIWIISTCAIGIYTFEKQDVR
jgi:ABC-2 type transport system permease protein